MSKSSDYTDHDDNNNDIYRMLRTAFELSDADQVNLWRKAGRNFPPSEANAFARSKGKKNYKPLYAGPLKKWMSALCEREGVTPKGFSVLAATKALCAKYNISSTEDPIQNTLHLRDALRPEHD